MNKQHNSEEIIKIITDYRNSLDNTGVEEWCPTSQRGYFDEFYFKLIELFNPTSVFKRGDRVEYRHDKWKDDANGWDSGEYYDYISTTEEHLVIGMYMGKLHTLCVTEIRKPQN